MPDPHDPERDVGTRGLAAPQPDAESGQIVRTLQECGLCLHEIARATGVSDRAVRKWLSGRHAARKHHDALCALQKTVLVLAGELTVSGVGQWFRSPNRLLWNECPIEVFVRDSDAVYGASQAFAEGAFV